ncbi:MAG: hypothetical protein K2K52_08260 [Paramuribaculum sp.]|nr:hypothetical protein [Paramuribaculum sp.]MDE6460800.1 hypothetical protein [Paramuribaculum sp.]MDE6652086.1 hypothetical protein [Paramuribaculum sp.]
MNTFDEDAAIKAVRESLPAEKSQVYTDDQILNVIDMIWDFYEENGLLEIDDDEEIEETALFDDLLRYVRKMLQKDKESGIAVEDIETIVRAEIDYENSLDSL